VLASEVNQAIGIWACPKDDQGKTRVKTPAILLFEIYCIYVQRQILCKNFRENFRTEGEALPNGVMYSFSQT
jgi:hypothetical protein